MLKRKKNAGKDDRATISIPISAIDEEMRMKVEERLEGVDPNWNVDSVSIPVAIDPETSQLLEQVVGMFPEDEIQLQTSHGSFSLYGAEYGASMQSREVEHNKRYGS